MSIDLEIVATLEPHMEESQRVFARTVRKARSCLKRSYSKFFGGTSCHRKNGSHRSLLLAGIAGSRFCPTRSSARQSGRRNEGAENSLKLPGGGKTSKEICPPVGVSKGCCGHPESCPVRVARRMKTSTTYGETSLKHPVRNWRAHRELDSPSDFTI